MRKVSLVLGLAGSFGLASAANATVLTFDGNICNGGQTCSNFDLIDDSYGDTAQVDVVYDRDITQSFATEKRLSFWLTDYNELVNVAWGASNDGAGTPMIFLNPLGGNSVTLNGFDLGAWPNAVRGSRIRIVDGLNNELFLLDPLTIGTGNLSSHFAFSLTSANGIGIQWGPSGYNVGIDNIDFGFGAPGIPEPASWALMIAGFGLVGGAARRRSKVRVTYA